MYKEIIDNDGVIIHSTDTVCGISGSYLSKKAYHEIYRLKKRPSHKPLGILLSKIELIPLFTDIPLKEISLILPLLNLGITLLLKRKEELPNHLIKQSPFIALRIPNHKKLKSLIDRCGPLLSTSANISGKPPIHLQDDIFTTFGENIPSLLEENSYSSTHSTIICYKEGNYTLIREGNISIKELKKHLPLKEMAEMS